MHSFVLQDWITIRGTSTTQVITQGESSWLDLAPYQDISLWLDVREFTGTTPTITFQTAPWKEDVLFVNMVNAITLALPGSLANPYRVPITVGSTLAPLARYVRWQLAGPASLWDATFRVLVSTTALGL